MWRTYIVPMMPQNEKVQNIFTLNYLAGITIRKEITVNFLELFHRKVAARAIFEKSFVPFLNFSICCGGKEKIRI